MSIYAYVATTIVHFCKVPVTNVNSDITCRCGIATNFVHFSIKNETSDLFQKGDLLQKSTNNAQKLSVMRAYYYKYLHESWHSGAGCQADHFDHVTLFYDYVKLCDLPNYMNIFN